MIERQNKLLASYQSPSHRRSRRKILKNRDESDFEDSDQKLSLDNLMMMMGRVEALKKAVEKSEEKNDTKSESGKYSIVRDDDANLNEQLWGKNCGEPVVLLKNNIYCKQAVFDDAENLCRKSATSFLRRLMDGVFKPDVLLKLNCTYTGKPPSAQGKDKQLEKVVPLDRDAKKALKEYCKEYATQKGWSKTNDNDLGSAMSQWIGHFIKMWNMADRFYYRNHLYYNKNKSHRWDCTLYPKCKAYVMLHGNCVTLEDFSHNHKPTMLLKTKNGYYQVKK